MRKILVAVDGSKLSLYVAQLALELAIAMKGQITLLTVISGDHLHVGETIYNLEQTQAMLENQKNIHEELKKDALKMLDSLAEKLHGNNISIEKSLKCGNPEEEIIKAAESGHYDLIVIGNRGFSATKKFFLGSVSKKVVTGAKCPVLVAKKP